MNADSPTITLDTAGPNQKASAFTVAVSTVAKLIHPVGRK
jgi:hypothetical protein